MTTEVHPISTISDNGEPPYFSWLCSCGKRVGGYHTSVRAFTAGEQHVEDAHPGALRQWRANEAAGLEQLRTELESVRADRDRLAAIAEAIGLPHGACGDLALFEGTRRVCVIPAEHSGWHAEAEGLAWPPAALSAPEEGSNDA